MKNVKSGHSCPIVCLDAGHYGKYNPSPVVKGYYESQMNWKLHNYLKAELEGYGIKVTVTRTSQAKDLALYNRGAASKGADLFLSIHSNACDTESVDRPVAIYLWDDNCGSIDEQSKEIAKLLADCVREVMQTKDKAQIYSKLASGDRDGDGKRNDDYYGVLYGSHQVGTTGVILEHSFHTNNRAAQWLLVDENLKKMASAEAKVIAQWFGVEKGTESPAEEDKKEPEKSTQQTGTGLPMLRKGSKGDSVKALQILLMGYGYSCGSYGADGDFGGATENAVEAFQKANNLGVDGVVGNMTWAKLLGV